LTHIILRGNTESVKRNYKLSILIVFDVGDIHFLLQLTMELSSSASLTSVSLGDVDGFGGLLDIPLGQPHALESLGTKRRRYGIKSF
jgi:hypothetical protein